MYLLQSAMGYGTWISQYNYNARTIATNFPIAKAQASGMSRQSR